MHSYISVAASIASRADEKMHIALVPPWTLVWSSDLATKSSRSAADDPSFVWGGARKAISLSPTHLPHGRTRASNTAAITLFLLMKVSMALTC